MAFWEIVIEGRQGVNDMLTVLQYQSSGVEPPDFDGAATVIRNHLETNLQPICGPRVTWLGITVREDTPGSVGVFYPFGAGILTGTSPNGDQIDQASVLVRKRSTGLVRPVLGWWFQGGISVEGTTDGAQWDVTVRDAVEAYAEGIRELNVPGPSVLAMLIKASNPTAPNTQPYSIVSVLEADTQVHTHRNRIPGRGS